MSVMLKFVRYSLETMNMFRMNAKTAEEYALGSFSYKIVDRGEIILSGFEGCIECF